MGYICSMPSLRLRAHAALLAVVAALAVPATSPAPAQAAAPRPGAPWVSAASVDEGDTVRIRARIRSPRSAKRVVLQRWKPATYSWEVGEWEQLRSTAVRGRATVKFSAVATAQNVERFRFVVVRKNGRKQTSRTRAVSVWRWIPLRSFTPYQTVGRPDFGSENVAGRTYNTWGAWLMWGTTLEGRFTAGRNCSTLTFHFGVTDRSTDGSSAAVSVSVDGRPVGGVARVVPGQVVPVTVALNRGYRFAVTLQDTSPQGAESYPVLAEPELRCSGF